MPDLLVIVPSRGRPHNIADLHDAWTAATTGPTGLLVAVDDDDPTLDDYRQVCADRGIALTVGPRLRMCPTLNKVAVEHAPHHFAIGFLGDDHRPRTRGWDEHYLAALRDLGTGFVYGNDLLAGERLPTQVAVTSDIVMALGWMVPDGILHLWADNVWLDLGRAIDRIRYLPRVVVEHQHYLNGKAAEDDRYREVNNADAAEADRLAYAAWLEHRMPGDVDKLKALLG
ncbi:hypothetical protein [Nonomuraea wenchangensis]|uniref:Glycosyltransferase n=1 Tax=Nonomuraea wenchangensis TaxID=568860 RepID=A0A1I0ETY2_9ACTN|nr:hypothetical protein [Nonomuraea wenchangensis]SET49044.1 hypothetical protein SAMN05421811_103205 [Nonomuraea wenchangensis]